MTVAVLSIATMSFAPFKDLRKGVKLDPERSEAQRTIDQQQYQGVQGEIAPPPVDTDSKSDVQYEGSDPEGKSALAVASQQSEDAEGAKKGRENLIQAEKDLRGSRSGGTWIMFGVLAALGGAIFFGVRSYASKAIPEMPSNNRGAKW